MKFIWTFLTCLIFAFPLSAQDKQRSEQIESVKVAFITQKLDLNSSEAEKFWPVYNNYQREMKVVFNARRAAKNDPDAKLDGELDIETRLLDTRKKYKQEFSKVIPSEKVSLFFQAEREFREQMIRELRERRKN